MIGKTQRGMDLFGPEQTMQVNCQGLPAGCLPSIANFDRSKVKSIPWDEIRVDQVLGNKELFQATNRVVVLGQSACNQHRYEVYVYQTAMILCSNYFPMSVAEGLGCKSDEDWLQKNIVRAELPPGQAWFDC